MNLAVPGLVQPLAKFLYKYTINISIIKIAQVFIRKRLQMIDPILAIEKIKNALKAEIDSGRLNGTYSESDKTISLYIYKTETETDPLLSFRVTDHRPIMQKYIRPGAPRPSTQDNTNMSVEFYIPRYEPDGTKKQNKFRNNVVSPITIEKVKPFSISSFNYDSRILEQGDDDCILKSIIDWLHNSRGNYPYKDPFENTPKAANVLTKTAKVKISSGEGGVPVTEIVHNNKVKLTESQLRRIIQESLIESLGILEEGKLGRALGTAALGAGLMFGHPQDANAQLQFKSISRNEQPKQPQCPVDREQLSRYNTIVHEHRPNSPDWEYYYIECNGYRFVLSRPTFCEISAKESTEMLKSFLHIIDSKIATAYSVCPNKHEYCFKYIPDKNAVSFSCTEEKGGSFILTKSEILKAISFIEINQLAWDMYNEEYRKSIRDLESRRNMAPSR